MRVLLTGASGFLGSHIAEQLDQQGAEVSALVRPTSDTRFLEGLERVTLVTGTMSDKDSLLAATEGVDGIIHAAAVLKARALADFRESNARGTANLLEAARRNSPDLERFVLVSSLAAMGPSEDGLTSRIQPYTGPPFPEACHLELIAPSKRRDRAKRRPRG